METVVIHFVTWTDFDWNHKTNKYRRIELRNERRLLDDSQKTLACHGAGRMTMTETENYRISVDVGGTMYEISRDTLASCEGSKLTSMIMEQWKDTNLDGYILIDRDGKMFEYVLDYLQTHTVFLPREVSRLALEREFEYYGIEADMTNVHDLYGFEHLRMIKEEIGVQEAHLDVLKSEAMAIQLSMFTELEYLRNIPSKTECVNFDIPKEYSSYNKALFKECLAARGLVYVRGTVNGKSLNVTKQLDDDTDTKE
ncbi:hypothetical protein FisN_14Hh052 [Fistulifera solaris]|jgi:hypothetical protein|uniref:BTB domain-containing protein n=1 Tax=Fistulifera solaris TaxID=1519565 RepID=A0A1Z5K915_FISSO|nr:hypothetical protein FisN_14Hh052 [Fistulifera solaris]|eukprot:GAX22438.1 hypothetical protein FisN_14Hh052 [Fistulifera solaris]